MPERTLEEVKIAAAKRLLFLPHAVRQMARPERMITTEEVERVVSEGQLIEDYPEDIRSHSCFLLGFGEGGRPIHVVCVPKENYLGIVTAYIPDLLQWSPDFKRRL